MHACVSCGSLSAVFLDHSPPYRLRHQTWSSLISVDQLASPGGPPSLFPQRWDYSHFYLFAWVLGVQTQVLKLVGKHLTHQATPSLTWISKRTFLSNSIQTHAQDVHSLACSTESLPYLSGVALTSRQFQEFPGPSTSKGSVANFRGLLDASVSHPTCSLDTARLHLSLAHTVLSPHPDREDHLLSCLGCCCALIPPL